METFHERTQSLLQESLRVQLASLAPPVHLNSTSSSVSLHPPTLGESAGQWTFRLRSVAQTRSTVCDKSSCQCRCHATFAWQSPSYLKRVLGFLFIGYSGTPIVKPACNEDGCRQSVELIVVVRYVFPAWFIARVLDFSLRLSSAHGLEQTMRVSTILPANHKIFDLLFAGDVEGVKDSLSTRKYSPFAVNDEGNTLLDVSLILRSTPRNILKRRLHRSKLF